MFTRILTWTTLTMAFGGPLWAQQAYRQVSSSDLVGGYIGNGEWVETRGHLWFSDAGVFFAVNVPSARAPIPVDVANLSPEAIARLKASCSAPNQFSGGCQSTIRGQTAIIGARQGVIAREIQQGQ